MSETKEINYEEKYKRHRESVKKANLKFVETHRDLVNQRAREYYKKKLAGNPEYLEKRRHYNRMAHKKRNGLLDNEMDNNEIDNSPKLTLVI